MKSTMRHPVCPWQYSVEAACVARQTRSTPGESQGIACASPGGKLQRFTLLGWLHTMTGCSTQASAHGVRAMQPRDPPKMMTLIQPDPAATRAAEADQLRSRQVRAQVHDPRRDECPARTCKPGPPPTETEAVLCVGVPCCGVIGPWISPAISRLLTRHGALQRAKEEQENWWNSLTPAQQRAHDAKEEAERQRKWDRLTPEQQAAERAKGQSDWERKWNSMSAAEQEEQKRQWKREWALKKAAERKKQKEPAA